MEQTQETATEAEAQGHRGLGLKGQGGVVQAELLQRLAEVAVAGTVGRVDACVDHGVCLMEAGAGLGGGVVI